MVIFVFSTPRCYTLGPFPVSNDFYVDQCFPQDLTKHEVGIAENHMTAYWFNFLREDIRVYLEHHATQIGGFDAGGEPVVVEIDKTKYFPRKYHKEAWHEGHWVFGGIE